MWVCVCVCVCNGCSIFRYSVWCCIRGICTGIGINCIWILSGIGLKENDTSILLSLSKLIERFTVVYINSIDCTISSVLKVFIVKNFSRRKETEVNSCDFDF